MAPKIFLLVALVLAAAATSAHAASAAPATSKGKHSKGGAKCPVFPNNNPAQCNIATLDNVFDAIDFTAYVGDTLLRYYQPHAMAGAAVVAAGAGPNDCEVDFFEDDDGNVGRATCTRDLGPASEPSLALQLVCPNAYQVANSPFCAAYVVDADENIVQLLPLSGSGVIGFARTGVCLASIAGVTIPPGGHVTIEGTIGCSYNVGAFGPPPGAKTEKAAAAAGTFGAAGKAASAARGVGGKALESASILSKLSATKP